MDVKVHVINEFKEWLSPKQRGKKSYNVYNLWWDVACGLNRKMSTIGTINASLPRELPIRYCSMVTTVDNIAAATIPILKDSLSTRS